MSSLLSEVLAANQAYAHTFGDKSTLALPPAKHFAILTDCGMELFTDEVMRGLLAQSLETARVDANGWHDTGAGPGSEAGEFIDWLTIKDPRRAVVTDVHRLRTHPLVPATIPIYGYLYDVKSGRLVEVPEATQAGTAGG